MIAIKLPIITLISSYIWHLTQEQYANPHSKTKENITANNIRELYPNYGQEAIELANRLLDFASPMLSDDFITLSQLIKNYKEYCYGNSRKANVSPQRFNAADVFAMYFGKGLRTSLEEVKYHLPTEQIQKFGTPPEYCYYGYCLRPIPYRLLNLLLNKHAKFYHPTDYHQGQKLSRIWQRKQGVLFHSQRRKNGKCLAFYQLGLDQIYNKNQQNFPKVKITYSRIDENRFKTHIMPVKAT